MRIRYLLHSFAIFFCFLTLHVQAQESFERTYPAGNNSLFGQDVQQTSDGGYLTLSFMVGVAPDTTAAIVTKFSPKGNVDWAKNYQFEGAIAAPTKLILLKRDTFAFVTFEQDGSTINRIITKVTPGGDVVWSKKFGTVTPPINLTNLHSLVAVEETNSLGVFGTIFENGENNLSFSFLDSLGNIEQAKLYIGNTDFNTVADAERSTDNGYIVTGSSNLSANQAFLFKLDSLKNNAWGRSYQLNLPLDPFRFMSVAATPDSGYLVVGTIVNANEGLILKVDDTGLPQWGKTLQLDSLGLTSIYLNHVVATEDGGYVVSGQGQDLLNMETFLVMFHINLAGDISWLQRYHDVFNLGFSGLVATKEAGAAYFSSGNSESSDLPVPYLAKINSDGSSSCEDTISYVTDTLLINVDTLVFETEDFNTIDTAEAMVTTFNDYQVPILSLDVPPPFCEDEPIMWTFDATTPGAVSYDWSTGETTDSITVMEEGMYIVDVRIETDICYNLCDTAMISVMGPPMVDIRDLGDFCLNGSTILTANVAGDSLIWNTGETTQSIEILEAGEYSVSVTNRCGVGQATFTVIQTPPTVMIDVVENSLCEGGEAMLTFVAPSANSFTWSDGSVVPTITVTAEDTYGVTVTNNCGTGEDQVTLDCDFPTEDCLDIPNVFTPNNDGTNDVFEAVLKETCSASITIRIMRIFNRWGQLVFETTTGQAWDGQFENKLAPSDVYVYYIEIENTSIEENDGIEVFASDVTLVR